MNQKSSLKTRIRRAIGKYLYIIYLPAGLAFEILSVFFNSLGREGRWLKMADIRAKKQSDTLYILGSGGSINRLTDQQWQDISSGDSFGINHWLLHSFVPTYYAFENSKPESRAIYFNNFAKVWDRYANTLMLYKDGPRGKKRFHMVPESFRDRFYLLDNPSLPILSVSQIDLAMRFLRRLLKWNRRRKKLTLFRKRASLLTIVEFGLAAGYRNIVLCGVDLNTSEFFYDAIRDDLTAKGYLVPQPVHHDGIHKTENPRHGEVTVSQLLRKFNDIVLMPEGVKLYIGSQSSALADWLPYYWEEKQE